MGSCRGLFLKDVSLWTGSAAGRAEKKLADSKAAEGRMGVGGVNLTLPSFQFCPSFLPCNSSREPVHRPYRNPPGEVSAGVNSSTPNKETRLSATAEQRQSNLGNDQAKTIHA